MARSDAEIEALADALLVARRTRRPMSTSLRAPVDTATAYRIQDAVARKHGGADGWKVGAKGPSTTPTCAPLLRGTVVELCGDLDKNVYAVAGPVGVEVEIAYRLGRDFGPEGSFGDEEILDSILGANIVVELCSSRLAAGPKAEPMWLLADNQMNERLIVGPPLASWRTLDSSSMTARIAIDGEPLVETVGGHPTGGPLRLLIWLVRHCAQRRGGLRSGQIITTGSWTGMPIIAPPAQITAEFATIASLTFDIADEPRG
jgi:2-keto-4-pentenoate hydratase